MGVKKKKTKGKTTGPVLKGPTFRFFKKDQRPDPLRIPENLGFEIEQGSCLDEEGKRYEFAHFEVRVINEDDEDASSDFAFSIYSDGTYHVNTNFLRGLGFKRIGGMK